MSQKTVHVYLRGILWDKSDCVHVGVGSRSPWGLIEESHAAFLMKRIVTPFGPQHVRKERRIYSAGPQQNKRQGKRDVLPLIL